LYETHGLVLGTDYAIKSLVNYKYLLMYC